MENLLRVVTEHEIFDKERRPSYNKKAFLANYPSLKKFICFIDNQKCEIRLAFRTIEFF